MSAVLQLRHELDKLKQEKIRLSLAADAAIKAARELLAASSYSQLHEVDLKTSAAYLQQAIDHQEALARVMGDIRRLERELAL